MPTTPEPSTLVLTNARIVAPGSTFSGWVRVRGRLIDAVGQGRPADGPQRDLSGATLSPGYIDLHAHGGGGATLYSGNPEDVLCVAATHLSHGSTSMMASITAAPHDQLVRAARSIAEVAASGVTNIAGIHFEGPFLSSQRPGAQPLDHLRNPDENELESLLAASGSMPVSMTIAPELPGALPLIARFCHRVRFFLGHTDASAQQFDDAINAGARAVTHLFNAMPGLHHRHPGPVARALLDSRVTSEIILDGHHLDDDMVILALAVAGADRLMLVTDAMAAAGMPDGNYSLPGMDVRVHLGAAYVAGTDTLAGSTLLMDAAVQRLLSGGTVNEQQVSAMSSTNAARVMGWTDRGLIEAGRVADLVATDESGKLSLVLSQGVVQDSGVLSTP